MFWILRERLSWWSRGREWKMTLSPRVIFLFIIITNEEHYLVGPYLSHPGHCLTRPAQGRRSITIQTNSQWHSFEHNGALPYGSLTKKLQLEDWKIRSKGFEVFCLHELLLSDLLRRQLQLYRSSKWKNSYWLWSHLRRFEKRALFRDRDGHRWHWSCSARGSEGRKQWR